MMLETLFMMLFYQRVKAHLLQSLSFLYFNPCLPLSLFLFKMTKKKILLFCMLALRKC